MKSNPLVGLKVSKIYELAAGKNFDALNFLNAFDLYFEEIERFVSSPRQDESGFIKILAQTNIIYSMPFYVSNAHLLQVPVVQLFNELADSIAFKTSTEQWKRSMSQFCGIGLSNVVISIALICGGFELCRQISPQVKELFLSASGDLKT